MVKKKYFLLLSTLLLTVLLGLFGTCYAKELSLNDVKNFICNYAVYHNNNYDVETLKTFLDNNESTLQDIIDTLNNNEGQYVVAGSSGVVTFWYYYGSATNLSNYGAWYRGSGYNYIDVNSSYLTRKYSRLNVTNLNNNFTTWQNGNCSVGATSTAFIYTDCIVRNNPTIASATQTIFNAGTNQPYDVFNSVYYTDDYFSFALNSDLSTIGIDDNGYTGEIPLINFINPADDILLGGISLAENFYNAELFEYRWHWDRWKLVNITTVDNVGTLSPSDNTLLRVYLNPNDYKRNTLYVYQFNPDPDSDFSIYSQPFFVKGANTVITNGNLNIAETFSGDYGLIYNNDTNTQSILDTLTDEQKENAALNDFDTILSGDASDVAGNLGFVNLASGGSGFFPLNIYTRLTDYFDQITDVLLESQPQTFSFYLHDNTGQIVLNTNDFITPNGPLKVFMQLFLVTCTIFVVWNQFYRYYELLSTFNVVLLMHDLDVEKTVFRM